MWPVRPFKSTKLHLHGVTGMHRDSAGMGFEL